MPDRMPWHTSPGRLAEGETALSSRVPREAVVAWAAGLGRFHAAGNAAAGRFQTEMMRRTGECTDYMDAELSEAARGWPGVAAALGVGATGSGFSELSRIPERFKTDMVVLSAADMCPDNNLLIEGPEAGRRRVALVEQLLAPARAHGAAPPSPR